MGPQAMIPFWQQSGNVTVGRYLSALPFVLKRWPVPIPSSASCTCRMRMLSSCAQYARSRTTSAFSNFGIFISRFLSLETIFQKLILVFETIASCSSFNHFANRILIFGSSKVAVRYLSLFKSNTLTTLFFTLDKLIHSTIAMSGSVGCWMARSIFFFRVGLEQTDFADGSWTLTENHLSPSFD